MTTRSKNQIYRPKLPFNYTAKLSSLDVPNTYTQAKQYPYWRKAMQDKFDALLKNHT